MSSDLYVTMEDIDVNRLHEIDIGLHNRFVAECRYYAMNWFRFDQAVKLHWNRTYAPKPVHLLRLKKPILPHRWINFREGWCRRCKHENLAESNYCSNCGAIVDRVEEGN